MGTTGTHRIVIAGGGFGGVEMALALHARLEDAAALTLVSDQDAFVFKPYLPYVPFGLVPERLKIDLAKVTAHHGVRLVRGRVRHIDPGRRVLALDDAPELPYDALVVATGARMSLAYVPGLQANAYGCWREDDLVRLRSAFTQLVEEAERGRDRRVLLLVPPESQWAGPLYELAFMLERWLDWKGVRAQVEVVFATAEARCMPQFGTAVHEALVKEFDRRNIALHTSWRALAVEPERVVFGGGHEEAFDLLVAAPRYEAAADWHPLPADDYGFLKTDRATRQVKGHPEVYAVGDASDFPVKQAYVALLQADAAAEHLAARLLGAEPAFAFDPSSLWIMEQFDQALLTQADLAEAGAEDGEGAPPAGREHVERLPVGQLRRMAIQAYLPWRLDASNPLYAGLLWKGTEVGLRVLAQLAKR